MNHPPALDGGAEQMPFCPTTNRISQYQQLGARAWLMVTPSAPPSSAGTKGEWKCS